MRHYPVHLYPSYPHPSQPNPYDNFIRRHADQPFMIRPRRCTTRWHNSSNNVRSSANVGSSGNLKRHLQGEHVKFVAQFPSSVLKHRNKRSCREVVLGSHFRSSKNTDKHVVRGSRESNVPSVPWQLPNDLLFFYEPTLKIPLMIDTGASRSLIPKRFLKRWDEASQIELQGLVDKTRTLGAITVKLDIALPFNPPLELLVVDDLLEFGLIGQDFLYKRSIAVETNPSYLTQTHDGRVFKVPLIRGGAAIPPSEWETKQSEKSFSESTATCEENSHDSSKRSLERKLEIRQLLSSENPYQRKLYQFPSLLEPANYLHKPAHNLVLDVEPTDPKGNVSPFRAYKKLLNAGERKIVREKLVDWVQRGILIKEAATNYTSPISLVPKKNGETRLCVNYRNFNARTRDLYYPLPSIHSLIETLSSKH